MVVSAGLAAWAAVMARHPPCNRSPELPRRSVQMREQLRAKGMWRKASDVAEGAGEVALVGKANTQGDFSQRQIAIDQKARSGADAQAARVFADAFAMEASKDARKVDGMDTSFDAEIVEGELVCVFRVEFFEDPGKPRGRIFALFEGEAGGEAGELGEQAFDAKRIGKFGGESFAKEIHAKPEK